MKSHQYCRDICPELVVTVNKIPMIPMYSFYTLDVPYGLHGQPNCAKNTPDPSFNQPA